jgi:hypothetical protein
MFNTRSILRTAAGVAVAALIAQPLAGCSAGASQFNPATASTPQNIAQPSAPANAYRLTRNMQPLIADINTGSYGGGYVCPKGEFPVAIYRIVAHPGTWGVFELVGYECEGPCLAMTSSAQFTYVGLAGKTIAVLAYAKGKLTQVSTLSGLSGSPLGMAADAHDNLWVTNSPTTTISEFAKGATKPTASYTDPNLGSISYLAIDKNDNVYVEGSSGSAMEIDELTASGTFTVIAKPGQVGSTPGGLAIAQHGKSTYLWVNDQGYGSGAGRISRYLLKGSSLKATGNFAYAGIDGAIAADPSGNIERIFGVNNVPSGSQFDASIVEYDLRTGEAVASQKLGTLPSEDVSLTTSKKP